jgi:hypothetical protein
MQRVSIPSRPAASRAPRAQATRPGNLSPASKGALILGGVVAGCYAGAYLGAAMDDSADGELAFIGMPIGGALGGLLVWALVR